MRSRSGTGLPAAKTYRCLGCDWTWLQQPEPNYSAHGGYLIGYSLAAACPRCGHDYVKDVTPTVPFGAAPKSRSSSRRT